MKEHIILGRFIEDEVKSALNEVNLDEDGLRQLLVHREEFHAYLMEGVRKFSAEVASDHNGLSRAPGLFHEWLPPPNWCIQDDHS